MKAGFYLAAQMCPNCQRTDISSYVPRGGDGTVRFFRTHVCYTTDAFRGSNAQHWNCRRVRAEVPGFQMDPKHRDIGSERPR